MWEAISGWGGWTGVGAAGAWLANALPAGIGLAGCFLPVIPEPLFILMAAVFHWFVFREAGVKWWTFAVLIALLAASQIFDFVRPDGLNGL